MDKSNTYSINNKSMPIWVSDSSLMHSFISATRIMIRGKGCLFKRTTYAYSRFTFLVLKDFPIEHQPEAEIYVKIMVFIHKNQVISLLYIINNY